ncbi:uncharacterized protein LOC133745217 isoform X2 [Rosa rugosa]|uniref:uncharacterized protein LOC133745217 isoform X2 n=1 Tax=Rosa rugosa TaxID=74645 RepID=UPI002B4170B9|nr:uncharacterized protein LOC133745217 isoform X2 [Rosa rugosa]
MVLIRRAPYNGRLNLLINTQKMKILTLAIIVPTSLLLWMRHLERKWHLLVISLVLLLAVLVLGLSLPCSDAIQMNKVKTRTSVYVSPKFVLEPGSVADKYFYNIHFPRGHIAMKYFNAEVIDEQGNPIPLHETYLHHWVIERYYAQASYVEPELNGFEDIKDPDFKIVRNSGLCQNNVLGQYYGLGSETRKTDTHVLDPFGIEIGNPAEIPAGYEERWMLNVHAIDTRGAEDRLGCTECRCDLYNVTKDGRGQPLRPGYTGGLHCCYDGTRCSVKQGYNGVKRSLYLRYTVKWVDWSDSIVPVKIYIFDVTDRTDHSGGLSLQHDCQDGRVLCSSVPIYGQSEEVGDEAGYIVGMSTCYPHPGSVKIKDGETLVVGSNYSSSRPHIGVMGLFYILVAEHLPKSSLLSLDSSL